MILVILRTMFMFAAIVFALRIMGKKQLGELQPSELVTTILVSNLASVAIENPELPVWTSVIPVFIIVALEILLSALSVKSHRASKLISGNPRIVIKDGVIQQQTLKSLRFSVDDLLASLRSKDIFELSEVDFAIVETSGTISAIKKCDVGIKDNGQSNTQDSEQFAQRNNANNVDEDDRQKKAATLPSLPVIIDGNLCDENISHCKIDKEFVENTCENYGCTVKDVLLLLCNDIKQTTLIKREG